MPASSIFPVGLAVLLWLDGSPKKHQRSDATSYIDRVFEISRGVQRQALQILQIVYTLPIIVRIVLHMDASTMYRPFFNRGFFVSKSIYVGNLPWSATEDQVRNLFSAYGTVESVKLVSDRETGRARGFGFVEMDSAGAASAIQALEGSSMDGRTLKVNEAQPKAPRPPRY